MMSAAGREVEGHENLLLLLLLLLLKINRL